MSAKTDSDDQQRSSIDSHVVHSKYGYFHDLSKAESLFYHLFYWGSAGYALYQFHLHSQENRSSLPITYLSKRLLYQDQNDLEWNVFLPLIFEFSCYGLVHLAISQLIRFLLPQLLLPFYVLFSSLALVKILGLVGALLCLSIPLVMFVALHSRLKVVVWLCWCFILINFNTEEFSQFLILWLSDVTDGEYKASVIAAWIILRSLSFSLDSCEGDAILRGGSSLSQLTSLLAYCFYFPLLFTGPYMPYSSFQEGLKKPVEIWDFPRFLWLFKQLARFSLWIFITDTLLYYFYAHCHQFSSVFTSKMDSWTLGGCVYFLLVFFFLKYVVYYGLMSVLAKAEGFEPPRHPRCVLLVHRFSDVWRYFDNGLYLFMTRHIYIPFLGEDRSTIKRIQASVIVFIFVYVWHGASPPVFWWATLNFFGVAVEITGKKICEQNFYYRIEGGLSGRGKRRLAAAMASLSLLLAVLSTVIFLSSIENAIIVFKIIFLKGFPLTTMTTMFAFYCIAQCGIDVDKWRYNDKITKNN